MEELEISDIFSASRVSKVEQKEELNRIVKFYECHGKPINEWGLALGKIGVEVDGVDLILDYNDDKLSVLDKDEFKIDNYFDSNSVNRIFKQVFSDYTKLDYNDEHSFKSIITLTYPLCKLLVGRLSRIIGDTLELKFLEEPFRLFNKIITKKDFDIFNNSKYIYNLLCDVTSIYVAMVNELKPLVENINPDISIDEFLIEPFNHIINSVKVSNYIEFPSCYNSFVKDKNNIGYVFMNVKTGKFVIYNDEELSSINDNSLENCIRVGYNKFDLSRYSIQISQFCTVNLLKLYESVLGHELLDYSEGYVYVPDIVDLIECNKLYAGDVKAFVNSYLMNSKKLHDYNYCRIEDAYRLLADCIRNNKNLIISFMLFIRYYEKDSSDLAEYVKSGKALNTLYDESCLVNLVEYIKSYGQTKNIDLYYIKISKIIYK